MSNRKFKTSEILERVENGQMLEELREKITEVVVGVYHGSISQRTPHARPSGFTPFAATPGTPRGTQNEKPKIPYSL